MTVTRPSGRRRSQRNPRRQRLPGGWRENLLGRTGADDDGRVFDPIDQAIERWV